MPAVRDRQRTCPKRRANPGGGDGRLPEARRDHGRAVRQAPARYRQAARPGRGIDDDRRVDHVTDRDRPGVVGGDTQGGREELVRWLTNSARGNSSGLCPALTQRVPIRRSTGFPGTSEKFWAPGSLRIVI